MIHPTLADAIATYWAGTVVTSVWLKFVHNERPSACKTYCCTNFFHPICNASSACVVFWPIVWVFYILTLPMYVAEFVPSLAEIKEKRQKARIEREKLKSIPPTDSVEEKFVSMGL